MTGVLLWHILHLSLPTVLSALRYLGRWEPVAGTGCSCAEAYKGAVPASSVTVLLGQRLLVVHLGHLLVQNEGIDYGDVHKVVKKGPIPLLCFMQNCVISYKGVRQIHSSHVPGMKGKLWFIIRLAFRSNELQHCITQECIILVVR